MTVEVTKLKIAICLENVNFLTNFFDIMTSHLVSVVETCTFHNAHYIESSVTEKNSDK